MLNFIVTIVPPKRTDFKIIFLNDENDQTYWTDAVAGSFTRFCHSQRGRRRLLPRLQPHHGNKQHRRLQVHQQQQQQQLRQEH